MFIEFLLAGATAKAAPWPPLAVRPKSRNGSRKNCEIRDANDLLDRDEMRVLVRLFGFSSLGLNGVVAIGSQTI